MSTESSQGARIRWRSGVSLAARAAEHLSWRAQLCRLNKHGTCPFPPAHHQNIWILLQASHRCSSSNSRVQNANLAEREETLHAGNWRHQSVTEMPGRRHRGRTWPLFQISRSTDLSCWWFVRTVTVTQAEHEKKECRHLGNTLNWLFFFGWGGFWVRFYWHFSCVTVGSRGSEPADSTGGYRPHVAHSNLLSSSLHSALLSQSRQVQVWFLESDQSHTLLCHYFTFLL